MSTGIIGALSILTVYLFLIYSCGSQDTSAQEREISMVEDRKLPKYPGITIDCIDCNNKSVTVTRRRTTTRYQYSTLFRDHIYRNLTELGKEVVFAVGIHPSCAKKSGYCIRRADCMRNHMLYISSVCYERDLVCCYDNAIENGDIEINTATEATEDSNIEQIEEQK